MLGQFDYTYETAPGSVYMPAEEGSLSWLKQIQSFGSTLVQMEYMRDLNEINLERARQGKEPLSPAEYAPTVNVGVAPDVQRNAMLALGAVAGGLALIMVLSRRR